MLWWCLFWNLWCKTNFRFWIWIRSLSWKRSRNFLWRCLTRLILRCFSWCYFLFIRNFSTSVSRKIIWILGSYRVLIYWRQRRHCSNQIFLTVILRFTFYILVILVNYYCWSRCFWRFRSWSCILNQYRFAMLIKTIFVILIFFHMKMR